MPKTIANPAASFLEDSPLSHPSQTLPETGFLRQRQVLAFVPFSKSTLWRRIKARTFPKPVKLSARITAWRAEDIRHWIARQAVEA